MMFVDTHAHLYSEEFDEDRDQVVANAKNAGINKIFLPNVDSNSIERLFSTENRYKDLCEAMIGLHPCYVKSNFESELQTIESWLIKRPFVAIGEIGLDYYWDTTYQKEQETVLRIQLNWAEQYNLPAVIHCRNSIQETIDIIKQEKKNIKGIFHCFSGTLLQAQEVIDMGFALGIGGVATFKNGGIAPFLSQINLEHIVLETDCPYLAPVPYRGKRNEPLYIPIIAQKLADLYQLDISIIAETTTENALRIFKLI